MEPQRLRVLTMMEFPTALGGERSLLSVAGQLREQIEFSILAPPGGELQTLLETRDLQHLPFSVRTEAGVRRSDEELLRELQPLIEGKRFDLLHANSVTLGRFLGRHRDQFDLPVTAHLRDVMKLSKTAIRDLSSLDRLIAVSGFVCDYYLKLGVEPSQIVRIYNGIDPVSEETPCDIRKEIGCGPETKLAATIGQIGLRKGHDTLIAALPKIAVAHPDWQFLIIGERFSGKQESRDYFESLQAAVHQHELTARVHWLGTRSDVLGILPQTDLLIHPARQEPFGRVLLEAAITRTAIVATDVGGSREMLDDTALLVPPDDPAALATACQQVMADANLRSQLAERAAARIREQFSLQRAASEHRALWESVLSSGT
ncbi:glycosyltransferase family 4 protein [Rubinisphaera margarita]|uniref:glycosyltransferase family 4 protein n=1 Tax=Rubinisphaera margarita TaxID=2909586 RepID=UPI001EE968D5|nr:glycosyltransferase family 4 protein [Rubinisphaera margarita]MCG6156764.1 glycosyltransferase family 4 protein [Rubinisphaera margarita]